MKIVITKDKGGVSLQTDDNVQIADLMDMLMTVALGSMNDMRESAPEGKDEEVRDYLYDNFNLAASTVLQEFAPDRELRPDLTEEAILEKQDEIMERVLKEQEKNENS
jgi:hypothetical protein